MLATLFLIFISASVHSKRVLHASNEETNYIYVDINTCNKTYSNDSCRNSLTCGKTMECACFSIGSGFLSAHKNKIQHIRLAYNVYEGGNFVDLNINLQAFPFSACTATNEINKDDMQKHKKLSNTIQSVYDNYNTNYNITNKLKVIIDCSNLPAQRRYGFDVLGNYLAIDGFSFYKCSFDFYVQGPSSGGGAISFTGVSFFAYNRLIVNDSHFISCSSTKPRINYGGAILCIGEVTISNSTFIDNFSNTTAGAIFYIGYTTTSASNASLIIQDSKFFNNYAASQGGAVAVQNYEYLLIDNCEFIDNVANASGGAIWQFGIIAFEHSAIIRDSKFIQNKATALGGAIGLSAKETFIHNNLFDNNTVDVESDSSQGGAIYISLLSGGSLQVNGTTFQHNKAYQGGAITCGLSSTMFNSTFIENFATNVGGGIYSHRLISLENVISTGNECGSQGCFLFNTKDTIAINSQFVGSNKSTSTQSGVALATSGPVSVVGCDFSQFTGQTGAAIFSSSDVSIKATSFNNCTAHTGGAIVAKTVVIANSHFAQCKATTGGAVDTGSATVTNSIFTNAEATTGGAINIATSQLLTIEAKFSGNKFQDCRGVEGGAIAVTALVDVVLQNNVFNKTGAANGGGVYVKTSLFSTNDTFMHSSATIKGAAIYSTVATLSSCRFLNISAASGAIAVKTCIATNCEFKNIVAIYAPAVFFLAPTESSFVNCSFTDNSLVSFEGIGGYKGNILLSSSQKLQTSVCSVVNGSTIVANAFGEMSLSNCIFEGVENPTMLQVKSFNSLFLAGEFSVIVQGVDYCGHPLLNSNSALHRMLLTFSNDNSTVNLPPTSMSSYSFPLGEYLLQQNSLTEASTYSASLYYSGALAQNRQIIVGAAQAHAPSSSFFGINYSGILYCAYTAVEATIALADMYNNSCACHSSIEHSNFVVDEFDALFAAKSNGTIVAIQPLHIIANQSHVQIYPEFQEVGVFKCALEFRNSILGQSNATFQILQGVVSANKSELILLNPSGTTVNISKIIDTTAGTPFTLRVVLRDMNGNIIVESQISNCVEVQIYEQQTGSNTTAPYRSPLTYDISITSVGLFYVTVSFKGKQIRSPIEMNIEPAAIDVANTQSSVAGTKQIVEEDSSFEFSFSYRDGFGNGVGNCNYFDETTIAVKPKLSKRTSLNCTAGVVQVRLTLEDNDIGNHTVTVTIGKANAFSFKLQVESSSNNGVKIFFIVLLIMIVLVLIIVIILLGIVFFAKNKQNSEELKPLLLNSDTSVLSFKELNTTIAGLLADTNILQIPLENIKLRKKVGSGAAGVVWLATLSKVDELTDTDVEIDVAVKELHWYPRSNYESAELTSFISEINLCSKLVHPNITRFIGICITGENILLLSEYMQNGAVSTVLELKAKEFTAAMRYKVLLDAATGMKYLHARNIIHRDLKPANFLLDEYMTCKLTDFGISTIKPEKTMTMTIVGSPAYMAPEVTRSSKYSEKADTFSFAIVMWQLLTGDWPYAEYASLHFITLINKVMNENLRPNAESIPKVSKALLEACWHHDPNERPTFKKIVELLQNIIALKDEVKSVQNYLDKKYLRSTNSNAANEKQEIEIDVNDVDE